MWFKNAFLFQFIEDQAVSAEQLEADLAEQRFMPCDSVSASSQGWAAPSGDEEAPLVHEANGFLLVCLKIEEKILPSSVVNDMLAEKIAEQEEATGRKVRKKEKLAMKDEIYHTLLPRAFSKTTLLHGYIDMAEGLLVVNTSSASRADAFTEALRNAMGSLKIQLPDVEPVGMLLTDWLMTQEYPADFVIADQCVLQDPREGGSIRCQKENIQSEEIRGLIETGREVAQMALSWCEQVSFVLKEDFTIRSIRFLEGVQDQANDIFTETDQARFDADFTIMTETLRALFTALLGIFGKGTVAEASETEVVTETDAEPANTADENTEEVVA